MAKLYIVATPIGNLGDISLRAIDILRQVDCIAAEDTRTSQKLLNHYAIKKRMLSLHEHNEDQRTASILDMLDKGQSVAIISDAGTPLISDPGYVLVAEAHKRNYSVVPVPGACAAIAALSVAGLPTQPFIFFGFLPPKGEKRVKKLRELLSETRTMVFYESVHRIVDLVSLMVDVFGADRLACLARELTKTFETVRRASLGELLALLQTQDHARKGEFVVIVAGAETSAPQEFEHVDRLLTILLGELSVKQSVSLAQKMTGQSRQVLYKRALAIAEKAKQP